MSHKNEHTQFLVQRLGKMGIKIAQPSGKPYAEGELPLSPTPFETLAQPIRMERARFYTLGYNKLKFCSPRALFALPAVDVSRCENRAHLESALRRVWASQIHEMRAALKWLRELGAEPKIAARGAQLHLPLTGEDGPPVRIFSSTEIQLPSSGPLAEVSLSAPVDRHFRPSRDLQHGTDLEIEISEAMAQLARRSRESEGNKPRARTGAPPRASETSRILVLDQDRATLTAAESLLLTRGYRVDTFQDPERALEAFRTHSYELVLTAGHMSRVDGLEFVAQARGLSGMDNLPVVLMDERFSMRQKREAAALGVAAFFEKPLTWPEIGPGLLEMLERPPMRRFRRIPLEMPAITESEEGETNEIVEEISRCGLRLRTQREVSVDAVERYRVKLPDPFRPVLIEGRIMNRHNVVGEPTVLAGVRIFRFLDGEESAWIQLIDKQLSEASEKTQE